MGTIARVGLMAGVWVALTCSSGLAGEKERGQETEVPSVVATVNGKAITGADYEKLLAQIKKENERNVAGPLADEAMKKEALERLIVIELLSQRTQALEMAAKPAEVEQWVQEVERRVGGREALAKELESKGYTREEYLQVVEKSLGIQKLLRKEVFDKVTVGPGEAKAFYESNLPAFNVPEQVRARQIVIKVPKEATEAQRRAAREEIEKAAERIKKGEAFEDVAREVSQDGSASEGGDLGYFRRGQMVPEFEKVAFSLEKGKLSGVVETPFGLHLIKVEDRRPARTISLEEAESRIEEYLREKKKQEGVRDYVEDLRGQATIEITEF